MTETAPARTNGLGEACPPWCQIDHAKQPGVCVGRTGSIGDVWAAAVRSRGHGRVHVLGSLPDPAVRWPALHLDPGDAEDLAAIVGLLAGATPDRHRQLAAAIRQAAAQVTEGGPS